MPRMKSTDLLVDTLISEDIPYVFGICGLGKVGVSNNPDFAAKAHSCGVKGVKVNRSLDFSATLEHAIKLNKPYVIDVEVDADVKPPSAGTWQLPSLQHAEPAYGAPWRPDM